MRRFLEMWLVGDMIAHKEDLICTVESFFFATLTHYTNLAASTDPDFTSGMMTALNLTCSRLVTKHQRIGFARRPPLYPLSRSLSATLITHFEGSADFVRQALSPFNPSNHSQAFPVTLIIKSNSLFPPIYGTLLMKIIKTVAA